MIKEESILLLLGAGASVDAGIPHAGEMTNDIEKKVSTESDYSEFKELYNYLKSSIIYQRGLIGDFNNRVVNIEDLLNVTSELKKKDRNQLYPFIGAWSTHLIRVAGDNFDRVDSLDKKIREQLLKWVNIPRFNDAKYFMGLGRLANEIGGAIRVFTLNYDLCVEKALGAEGIDIELGFDSVTGEWEASKFDRNDERSIQMYLYKLHGSVDWERDKEQGNILKKCDNPCHVPDLIFGTASKLESIDPYLFYVHEFRRYSLEQSLKLIITVGYSFSDDYLNKLIRQAVSKNNLIRVVVISPTAQEKYDEVTKKLGIKKEFVLPFNYAAKEFFENHLNLDFCQKNFKKDEETPF